MKKNNFLMEFFFHLPDTGGAVYGSSLESVINYPSIPLSIS
jgi:hypothetical protein